MSWLFAAPWTAACQASLSFTISQSLLKLMSTELVMPSNHLILLSPSPLTFNLSQHYSLFQWIGSSYLVAKVLEFQPQHQILRLFCFYGKYYWNFDWNWIYRLLWVIWTFLTILIIPIHEQHRILFQLFGSSSTSGLSWWLRRWSVCCQCRRPRFDS